MELSTMSATSSENPEKSIHNLEERLKKVGMEKSYFQLIINMIEKLSQVPEMEDTILYIPKIILSHMGGN